VTLLLAMLLAQSLPQPRLFMQPNLARLSGGAATGCGHLGAGPCDSGSPSPAFQGFALGTFGWGPECSGWLPLPATLDLPRYSRTGLTGFTGTAGLGMYRDNSGTCCKSDGNCVEMWGDDPDTGGNFAETPVSIQQYGVDAGAYGVTVSYGTKQWLACTRDLSASCWTTSGSGTVTASAYQGPFGYYLGGPDGLAMAKLHDSSGANSFTVSQTVSTSTAGRYSASCWVKGDSVTAVRLAMAGTGNAGGDRTCTKTSINSTAQGTRYGCVGTASYTGAVTAITFSVSVGSASSDTGDIGVSDCQLERDTNGVGIVSNYVPNTATSGTLTRGNSSFIVARPDAGFVDQSLGCLGMGYSRRQYDAEGWFTVGATQASPGSSYIALPEDSDFLSRDTASHVATLTGSIYTRGFEYTTSEWDAGSSLKHLWNSDFGVASSSFTGTTLWPNTSDLYVGTTGGATSNMSEGQFGPIVWGANTDSCRSVPSYSKNGHRMYVVGDGWSGGGTAGDSYPTWVTTVRQVLDVDTRGTNVNNQTYYDGGSSINLCIPGRLDKFGYGIDDTVAIQVGNNDIGYGCNGATLFTDQAFYAKRKARMGINVFWFNLAPTEGAHQAQKEAFNAAWLTYCTSDGGMDPEPNMHCVDMHGVLAPDGGDYTLPAYKDLFASTVGAAAVGSYFLSRWSP
jgi:hypothetical protein